MKLPRKEDLEAELWPMAYDETERTLGREPTDEEVKEAIDVMIESGDIAYAVEPDYHPDDELKYLW